MPFAKLYLTDGTTSVELLTGVIRLSGWRPARAPLKAGGTWQSSPFSDGRRLVTYRRDNVIDTFSVSAQGYTQDELIYACQEADRLLTKAMDYWTTSWQDTPVYLVAKGPNETFTRYAHIHAYQFPNAANPYAEPFHKNWGRLSQEDLTIVIEHGGWTQFRPGGGGCTLISALSTYNSRTYGRDSADVCDRVESIFGYILKEDGDKILLELGPPDALMLEGLPFEVYVVNKANVANLTNIWQFTPGPAWVELIDAIPPTTGLFAGAIGGAVANGSILYFSIDSTVDDSGPFCSLVFDIDTAATIGAATTLDWEYPTAAAVWAALPVRDNTASFQSTFVNSVHWEPPANWYEAVNVNGTVGYCVRCVVSGVNMTNPSQQNRRIYTITWPHYELDAEDIGGDVAALVRTTADNQADDGSPDVPFNKMWLGLRSLGRGTGFVPFLNVADEQNPTGITTTTSDGGGFVVDDTAPTGLQSTDTVTNVNPLTITWSMDSTIMLHYWGTYHAFVRGKQAAGASGDVRIQIITQARPSAGGVVTPLWESEYQEFTTTNDWEMVDMGKVSLPPIGLVDPLFDIFEVLVEVTDAVAGSTDVTLYDLVLMPVDEWAGSFSNVAANAEVDEDLFLDVDSVSDPKRLVTAVNRISATGRIFTAYQVVVNDHALVHANTTQRMYHLFALDEVSKPCISCGVWLFTNQKYLMMRGDR